MKTLITICLIMSSQYLSSQTEIIHSGSKAQIIVDETGISITPQDREVGTVLRISGQSVPIAYEEDVELIYLPKTVIMINAELYCVDSVSVPYTALSGLYLRDVYVSKIE